MSETKHTPGEWTTKGQWKLKSHVAGIFKRGEGYLTHCRTLAYVGPNPHLKNPDQIAEAEANALLMAAAPELLERLQAMTSIVKAIIKDMDEGGAYHSLPGFGGRTATENVRESLAAIAKAGTQ